jgi:hypothetical protein
MKDNNILSDSDQLSLIDSGDDEEDIIEKLDK